MPVRNQQRIGLSPHCLIFFMDETGHEEFADQDRPVFGIGGCAAMSMALADVILTPWRKMKETHFGGAHVSLHANELRNPSQTQIDALNEFFRSNPFGRFAVTTTAHIKLPPNRKPYDIMPFAVRRCWQQLTSRCHPPPTELALVHEASQRGDKLVKRYFGKTVAEISGNPIPVHHVLMPKRLKDEALEVADFIVHTAGGQAYRQMKGDPGFRPDFQAIFGANPLWSHYIDLGDVDVVEDDD